MNSNSQQWSSQTEKEEMQDLFCLAINEASENVGYGNYSTDLQHDCS